MRPRRNESEGSASIDMCGLNHRLDGKTITTAAASRQHLEMQRAREKVQVRVNIAASTDAASVRRRVIRRSTQLQLAFRLLVRGKLRRRWTRGPARSIQLVRQSAGA